MFEKVLIANRGEIAVRVIRACGDLGIRSVAIYSEADEGSLHASLADEAYPCGPARATESYLDIEKVVALARRAGVDAVHPGYGFLSENAEFAEAVGAAGMVFIGPTPEVIRSMGLKVAARDRMIAAGVPVVPGCDEIVDLESARNAAREIGYPVLVKASAGGGGRGMRRVDDESELATAIERARSEAAEAFGDGAIYLEKFLLGPRHIEIQIMADAAGRVIHLGERECSIQRRHQKLVEEAPAFGMTPSRREEMGQAAIRAARAVGYVGAGTCEFLLDARGDFYFLEMNTRIQVEHPVTEAVTGVDLVEAQIRVAAGERLELDQDDVRIEGHAIEARIYAEDPDKGFIPSPGKIELFDAPVGDGVRLDSGFEEGQTVTPFYDPMIAKLIVHGRDRNEALSRTAQALEGFSIAGIRTGLPFLRRLVVNPVFQKGAYDTAFIESEMSNPLPPLGPTIEDRIIAVTGIYAAGAADAPNPETQASPAFELSLPKREKRIARVLSTKNPCRVELDGKVLEVDVDPARPIRTSVACDGATIPIEIVARKKGDFDVGLRDRVLRVKVKPIAG